mmetsp:Transcript_10061/g.15371  ORF Transcript_10061/g.15371 Transcript_10061/m.15371 type:complete len:91 (+) Transcript_10061:6546-6818(+)
MATNKATPEQATKIGGTPEVQTKFFTKPFLHKGAMQLTMQPDSTSSENKHIPTPEEEEEEVKNTENTLAGRPSSGSDEFENEGPRQKRFS